MFHCLQLKFFNEICMSFSKITLILIETIGNVGWCVINDITKEYHSQNKICTMQILLR